jgi:hypothetical protein
VKHVGGMLVSLVPGARPVSRSEGDVILCDVQVR